MSESMTPQNDAPVNTRWIKVTAEMCDHPALAGPYDRRSAWLWLIANATWKDRSVNNKGKIIKLQRGQILAGRAFLAKQWGWSEKKVRNFIDILAGENMVKKGQSSGHFANVLTICNYERYQTQSDVVGQSLGQSGASQGPVRGQTLRRVIERVEDSKIDSPIGESSETVENPDLLAPVEAAKPDVLQQAVEVWNEAAAKAGLPKVRILSAARRSKLAARLKDAGGIDGWREAIGKLVASDFLTGKVKDWKADFGFVLQQESFARLVEGGYDNRRNAPRANRLPPQPVVERPFQPSAEYMAELMEARRIADEMDRNRPSHPTVPPLTTRDRINQH